MNTIIGWRVEYTAGAMIDVGACRLDKLDAREPCELVDQAWALRGNLVAYELTDLSAELAGVGNRDAPFPLPTRAATKPIVVVPVSIRAACQRAEIFAIRTTISIEPT